MRSSPILDSHLKHLSRFVKFSRLELDWRIRQLDFNTLGLAGPLKAQESRRDCVKTLMYIRSRQRELFRYLGDIALVVLARGLLSLALAPISGFGGWIAFWPSVQGLDDPVPLFVLRMTLVIGVPAGVATVVLWWNTESPTRVRVINAAVIMLVATALPAAVMAVKGVETYYALFAGTYRIPVIDVSDALITMVASAGVGTNVVAAALSIYRMARYREI